MTKGQKLSIIAFLLILVFVYLFGKTKDPSLAKNKASSPPDEIAEQVFDFDAYFVAVKENLPGESKNRALQFDTLIASASSNSIALQLMDSTISFYTKNNQFLAATHYYERKAKLTNDADQWRQAGDAYARFIGNPGLPPGMFAYVSERGINAYEEALDQEADNKDVKIGLASIYLEDDGQVMNGVQLLLGVIAEDKNNPGANLLLGKYGIISGQFEKAITRLENVVSSQPENAEALFLLAEAYNGSGNKDKAIAAFERCKQLINNADFRKEIDSYIENINNR